MKRKLTYLVIASAFACWTAAVGAQTPSAPGTGAGSPTMKGSEGIEQKGSAATANNPNQSGTTTSNTNLGHGNTGMSSGSDADRARIDADYRAARDACNGKTGKDKSDCLKDARKAHDEERAEWRKSHPAMKHASKSSHSTGSMGSMGAGAMGSSRNGSMSSPSTGTTSPGNISQCANMTGADKDKCMDALKAK